MGAGRGGVAFGGVRVTSMSDPNLSSFVWSVDYKLVVEEEIARSSLQEGLPAVSRAELAVMRRRL